eukprot:4095063-Prymnesium_polylepis.1
MGLNPWSNSDRRMTMCNELATMRHNEEAEKKALIESRISHIAEKEMQRSLELALAESIERKSFSSSCSSVASDYEVDTYCEIEEIDEEEDEEEELEEEQDSDFYGLGCA